jgi:ATP-dependent HslUV protease ATP-binding subunit HslU
LLSTEGLSLEFTDDALSEIAEMAEHINDTTEDIGARRLHTLLEKVLEEISFEGSDLDRKEQRIDAEYVKKRLSALIADESTRKSIL